MTLCRNFIVCTLFLTIKNTVNGQLNLPKPNIILIIGDDISRDDIGAYGKNQFIHTPNLDEWAQKGTLFDHFFVTSSSCSPSRTSLLTARYPHNSGAPELHQPLPSDQVYFPELLKKNGYFTALLGKWHEGENTRRAYDTLITGVEKNGEGGEEQWISILKNRPKDKPFFLWLASFDAHRDWDVDKRFQHSSDSVLIPKTLVNRIETRKDLAHYYNEIERLDYYIGKLQAELVAQKITNNTIIIFIGDNGRPFPGDKTRLLDRGTNTPLIFHIPYATYSQHSDVLISGIDVAPTILDLAGIRSDVRMQGYSFKNVLLGRSTKFRNYIFAEHNWHDYRAFERSVRTNHFLYIKNDLPRLANQGPLDAVRSPSFSDLKMAKCRGELSSLQNDVFLMPRPSEELYDLQKDTLQQYNLIGNKEYLSILKSMRSILQKWKIETKDNLPDSLTPDWYGRWDGETLPAKNKRGISPGFQNGAQKILKKGPF